MLNLHCIKYLCGGTSRLMPFSLIHDLVPSLVKTVNCRGGPGSDHPSFQLCLGNRAQVGVEQEQVLQVTSRSITVRFSVMPENGMGISQVLPTTILIAFISCPQQKQNLNSWTRPGHLLQMGRQKEYGRSYKKIHNIVMFSEGREF